MALSMSISIYFAFAYSQDLSGPYLPLKDYSGIEEIFRHFPAYRFLEILCGIFLGIWMRTGHSSLPKYDSKKTIILSISIVILVTISCMYSAKMAFLSTHGLFLPLIIIWFIRFANDNDILCKFGKNRWMRFLSDHSVAIYFAHYPIHRIVNDIVVRFSIMDPYSIWYIPLYLICLSIVGMLVKRIVDKISIAITEQIVKPRPI